MLGSRPGDQTGPSRRAVPGHPKRTGGDPYDTGTIDFGFRSDSGESLAQQRRDTGRRHPYKAVIHTVADEHPR